MRILSTLALWVLGFVAPALAQQPPLGEAGRQVFSRRSDKDDA
jgi:hypothetical protein